MTLLELLKLRGKTLVLQGPQGCGKTLLAKQLAGNSHLIVHIDKITSVKSNVHNWLKGAPKVVIVEGLPKTKDLDLVKSLIASTEITYERKGIDPILVKTPTFIFCADGSRFVSFGENDRRFFAIKMRNVI